MKRSRLSATTVAAAAIFVGIGTASPALAAQPQFCSPGPDGIMGTADDFCTVHKPRRAQPVRPPGQPETTPDQACDPMTGRINRFDQGPDCDFV